MAKKPAAKEPKKPADQDPEPTADEITARRSSRKGRFTDARLLAIAAQLEGQASSIKKLVKQMKELQKSSGREYVTIWIDGEGLPKRAIDHLAAFISNASQALVKKENQFEEPDNPVLL